MLPKIKRAEPGNIHIDDEILDTDFFLHAKGIEKTTTSKHVSKDDIERMLVHEPEAVVIGAGFRGKIKVEDRILRKLEKAGIDAHVVATPDALEKFKSLARTGKKVVAKIHVSG